MKHAMPVLAALSVLVAAPAWAQAPAPEKAPSITSNQGPGGRAITSFDRRAQSRVGGYFDNEFSLPLDGKDSTFRQHRLILQASSYLHENLFFNTEIEYEYGGQINANTKDGELKIEQAWADYRINDALSLRGGVVLVPFGIVNVLHDSDVRETTNRPLMADKVVPSTWMDTGAGFHGFVYPTEDMQVSYEAYVTNGLSDKISADKGLKDARPSFKKDNNGNKAVSGRLSVSPWLGLDLGLSGYRGVYDANRNLSMLGADTTLSLGPVEILGEYANVQSEGGTFAADATQPTVLTSIPGTMEGYYVEGRYRFFPEILHGTFMGREGGFPQASMALVGRYGQASTDKANPGTKNDQTEYLVGLNYRPIQTFVTKLEYQRLADPIGGNKDAIWSSIAVGF
ncbi:MAG TPA: porin [Pantanalinema sp.]